MKFIIRLLVISLTCFLTAQFMPWWSIIWCAAIVSFIVPGSNFNAFLSGFLGVGLLWLVTAWKIDVETNSIMSSKIVQLFPIDDASMLIIFTGFLGALVGGLSAITGNSFKQIFIKKKKESLYA